MIVRNGHGLPAYLRGRSNQRALLPDSLLGLGIVVVAALLFVFTFLDCLRGIPLLYVLVVYALFLDLSLWAGWMRLRGATFPGATRS
jgi:hypothetical protein